MLEPRRIAARAVATRMAQLLGEPVGRRIGYRTRLDTKISRDTRIEVVTEGILTRMLQQDSDLSELAIVIFDEFHERSLNADLGLALCIESQQTLLPDLRLLIMSATLDLQPLARLLDAPILSSSGRSFEVITHYVPRRERLHLEAQAAQVIKTALHESSGDILCFLPGAAEIRRVQRNLEESSLGPKVQVLPLYGELTGPAQDAALNPAAPGYRKIVLATTIAETSLTIEGIRVVVDAGLRRYAEFDPTTGMSRLVTNKVSQASADQRRGRAGRLSTGVCYRLWSEGTQATLAPQTAPEILHADLAPLALELSLWGATDAASLQWLDSPPPAPLAQARELLHRLEAIDSTHRITPHGRELAKIAAHPRLAHMLVKSKALGATRLACDLAALLSERDILRATPNSRDVDLRLRITALQSPTNALPPGITLDTRAHAQATRSSAEWQRQFRASGTATIAGAANAAAAAAIDPHEATGILLALAYPDRIARARGESGRYLLANGRGARFGEPQALAKSEYIVIAELDGAEREAKIFLAAPIAATDIEKLFDAQIESRDTIVWDERSESIRAKRERCFGALILDSIDIQNPDSGSLTTAAIIGIRQMGIQCLPWTRDLKQWQARVQLMRQYKVPGAEAWPDLSDAALLETLEEWAPPWISGFARREHFAKMKVRDALQAHLSYAQSVILEKEAPTHFIVPSGSTIPIDYLDGDVPTISVRLQEVFGLNQTPSVANKQLPLLLKLLSPAGRPVQITRDLVSFWNRGYHEVKKDLKGRYPKHYWPDDPFTAEATRRRRPKPN